MISFTPALYKMIDMRHLGPVPKTPQQPRRPPRQPHHLAAPLQIPSVLFLRDWVAAQRTQGLVQPEPPQQRNGLCVVHEHSFKVVF